MGKGLLFDGSAFRPEATGFSAVYYLKEVLKHEKGEVKDRRVVLAGFGDVARGVVTKLAELGAKAAALSGPDGYVYDPGGVMTKEKIDLMLEMRAFGRNEAQNYADKFGVRFFTGRKSWGQRDVGTVMPCVTQNDVNLGETKEIVANGIKYYIEVVNTSTTNEALKYLPEQKNAIVAPSKIVSAGDASVSALEVSQNSEGFSWDGEEVDK